MVDSPWRIGFIDLTRPRVSVQLICNHDKEVQLWVSFDQQTPSQLISNITEEQNWCPTPSQTSLAPIYQP